MEPTAQDIEGIPPGNLRVQREEFVAVWAAAERRQDRLEERGEGDWYLIGVLMTCRWIATAMAPALNGRTARASAPLTHRHPAAHEESIEAEYRAAELWAVKNPDGAPARPGWIEAVRATLAWAWRASGPPPLDVDRGATG